MPGKLHNSMANTTRTNPSLSSVFYEFYLYKVSKNSHSPSTQRGKSQGIPFPRGIRCSLSWCLKRVPWSMQRTPARVDSARSVGKLVEPCKQKWIGPNPKGPKMTCDRAIWFSGLGVCSSGPVGDFLDGWVVSWGSWFGWGFGSLGLCQGVCLKLPR